MAELTIKNREVLVEKTFYVCPTCEKEHEQRYQAENCLTKHAQEVCLHNLFTFEPDMLDGCDIESKFTITKRCACGKELGARGFDTYGNYFYDDESQQRLKQLFEIMEGV